MQYSLIGFTHHGDFRIFTFDGVDKDRTHTEFHVRADLALSRGFGIPVQELPLLCRGILERLAPEETRRNFTYTETQMSEHAGARAARTTAAQQRRPPRRPPAEQLGGAWRSQPF
jgi:hypothetical protein